MVLVVPKNRGNIPCRITIARQLPAWNKCERDVPSFIPPKINIEPMVWKMFFLFQGCILRFHLNLPGCNHAFIISAETWNRISLFQVGCTNFTVFYCKMCKACFIIQNQTTFQKWWQRLPGKYDSKFQSSLLFSPTGFRISIWNIARIYGCFRK